MSGDGRRTRFPAHASFRTPSEGLTEVGWVQQEKGSHGGPTMSQTILCSSGSSLCRHPNRSPSSVCRTTSHLFRPNRFSHLFISFTFFFWPLQTIHEDGFDSVSVLTIPSSQRVSPSFSPGHYSGPQHFHTECPVPQPCLPDAAGVGGNLLSFGMCLCFFGHIYI